MAHYIAYLWIKKHYEKYCEFLNNIRKASNLFNGLQFF